MEQEFEIEGYRIFTKVEGEGSPVLLIHSYWGSQCLFDHLSSVLLAKMKVIRLDLPGHGYSNTPPADFTFDNFAVVLNKLLYLLNIPGKISIVGHSMGGYVALAFAAKYPERMSSLVLMHSLTKEADARSKKLREREGHFLVKGKKDLLMQVMIPSNFAPKNVGKMTTAMALIKKTSDQISLEGALSAIHAINNRCSTLDMLKVARYPILFIIGKYDKVYRPDEQMDEASQIPNAEVLMLNHSGHMGFIEEEDVVLIKLQDFFNTSFYCAD